MTTFADLSSQVKFFIGNDYIANFPSLLRMAENEFIEQVPCTEAFTEIDTSAIGAIATIESEPTAGGTGYVEDEVLTLTSGSGDATVTASAVVGGVVTEVTLVSGGTNGYEIGTGEATSGGSGEGCTIEIATLDLTHLYDLPSDFCKEYKIQYDGDDLESYHRKSKVAIYDNGNNLITGTPGLYMITQDLKLWLIHKPNFTSKIGIWYKKRNTSTTGTSPIIPSDEHDALINWVIMKCMEKDKKYDEAIYYKNEWEKRILRAQEKYNALKFKQERIEDIWGETEEQQLHNTDSIDGYF